LHASLLQIDPADIRLGEKIGEGEFGIVFKVRSSITASSSLV
jgi:hypothetical protein